MFTGFQALLNQGTAFVEEADPELITIAGFPLPLPANIGQIYRRAVMTGNGFRTEERGRLDIRRATLARLAPGKADPASHTEIVVRGKTYRVDFTNGDTITLCVEFASFV